LQQVATAWLRSEDVEQRRYGPRSPADLNRVILRNLMPLLVAAYAMCFLDRTNIGIAKSRLQIDLGLSATAYGIGAGLFFITYAALRDSRRT